MFGFGKKDKAKEKEKPSAAKGGGPAVGVKEARPPKAEEPASDLKVKVTDRKPCRLTLSVQVSWKRVEGETEESFRRIQGRAKLPGFRPGKAPMDMVRQNFEGAAREDALDRLLRKAATEALEKEKAVPVVPPTIDKVQFQPEKPLSFEVAAECAPEVDLKDYKGLPLEKGPTAVSDEDVKKRLDEVREGNAKLVESKAEKAADDHFLVVDYVGLLDGLPIPDGRAEGQLIDLSAPQSIAGFSDGLKGAKAGETREVPVKFPDEHPNKALAGKPVVFKVTVQTIKEKQLPVLDDEFAKDMGCKDLADLTERVRLSIAREREKAVRQSLERQVTEKLLERHAFDVPPSLVEDRAKHLTDSLKQYLLRGGASEEDWKANEEKMVSKNRVEAERQIRLSYVLERIAEAEKLEVSDEEVARLAQHSLETADPGRRREMERWLAERGDHLRAQIREEKIFTLLIDKAAMKEVAATPKNAG
jgi:trigger factor